MGFTVSIGGSARAVEQAANHLQQAVSARQTFSTRVLSSDGSYVPAEGDEVQVTEDGEGSAIMGGFVETPVERGALGIGNQAVTTDLNVVGYEVCFDRTLISLIIPAGSTLKEAMQLILAASEVDDDYGIAIDAGQVDGPTLSAELPFDWVYAADAVNQLQELTGYLSTISPSKVWTMALPGASAAPFNISDGDGNVEGDLVIERGLDPSKYGNRVVLRCGTGTALDNWTQDFTQVGSELEYVSDRMASQNPEDTFPNVVVVDGAIVAPAGWGPDQLPAGNWYWDYVNHTLVNGTGVALSAGQVVTITHAISPIVISENTTEQASHQRRDLFRPYPAATTYAVGKAEADAQLAAAIAGAIRASYYTYQTGLRPGQSQTINSTIRHVNSAFTITEIEAIEQIDGRVRRKVTAVGATAGILSSWRDAPRSWGGATAAGGVVTGTVVIESGGGSGTGRDPAYFLGGSEIEWVQSSGPDWVPASAVELVIDGMARASLSATVRVRLRARSGSVTARLRNTTDGTTAGISSAVTSTSFQTVSFGVTLAAGAKTYRLEVLPGTADVDVAAVGYLE